MASQLLEVNNITKIYPNGVIANKKVNFSLNEGEIHAVVGENGAGKSTLMKILFGMEEPSEGELRLRGELMKFRSPQDAIDHGIGMVHQHFMLVPSFTVAENMILGVEPKKGFSINYQEAIRLTKELSDKYHLQVDPTAKVEDLSVGMKQKVEILKALLRGAKILILDEPTAVLTPQETKELFQELKLLKDNGHTVVFISHKLKEVKEICDRITVMRNGTTEGVFSTADVTEQEISRLMVGRDVILKYEKDLSNVGQPILKVNDVTYVDQVGKKRVKEVCFSVRAGEIVGIAGVEGNGQTQLVELLTGQNNVSQGQIHINEVALQKSDLRKVRSYGVSYIPEDRLHQGAAKDASISDNFISTRYQMKGWNRFGVLNIKRIAKLADDLITSYRVKCFGPKQQIGMLSGGNMQKVVVARECSMNPKLLIAEQPTRGVDVGAAQLIHQKLLELRGEGSAILMISADLNEILELSDSLIVLYDGEIVAYFDHPTEVTEEELGLYMLGLKRQNEDEIRRASHF